MRSRRSTAFGIAASFAAVSSGDPTHAGQGDTEAAVATKNADHLCVSPATGLRKDQNALYFLALLPRDGSCQSGSAEYVLVRGVPPERFAEFLDKIRAFRKSQLLNTADDETAKKGNGQRSAVALQEVRRFNTRVCSIQAEFGDLSAGYWKLYVTFCATKGPFPTADQLDPTDPRTPKVELTFSTSQPNRPIRWNFYRVG